MPVIPAVYGPALRLIHQLSGVDDITIGAGIPYEREMSRMRILSASGPLLLSIPVNKHPRGTALSQIRADQQQNWRHQHWRSIASAYGKSPFFQYFVAELEDIFRIKSELLAGFSAPLLAWILKQYFPGKKIQVNLAAECDEAYLRAALHSKGPEDKTEHDEKFSYRQVFGSEFAAGLCTIDHLFCAGPKNIWRLPD